MTDWQPIETAPKDGRHILVWGAGWAFPSVVHWMIFSGTDSAYDQWCYSEGGLCREECSPESWINWMPLPAAPA